MNPCPAYRAGIPHEMHPRGLDFEDHCPGIETWRMRLHDKIWPRWRAIRKGEPCIVAHTRGPVWYIATVTQALRGWGYGYLVRQWIERRRAR